MRISTQGIHTAAVNAILKQQAALSLTQQQVASGKRIQSAADDPSAAVQLKELARLQSQHEQFDKNSTALTGQLQLEEQGLADSTQVLQRIRDLVLQANSSTTTASDLQAIRTEIKSRIDELQGIANQRDNAGDYLFAGTAAASKPFVRGAAGAMGYNGNSGEHTVRIDAGVDVPSSDAGSRVFSGITAGNGLFTTGANAANAGSGSIDTGAILQSSSWVPGQYALTFTAPDTWQVTDAASTVVASGSYTSGGAISFRGVQVAVSGVPATGDSFSISTASTTDMFSQLDAIVAALGNTASGDAARAQLTTALGGSLQQIDQTLDHISSVRAEVGARLSLADDLTATRQTRLQDIATSQSQLQDLDYASAISRMNQQMVGLQAAQQSFSTIARLTLFNYL
jgi:flagellar hook-associated protein 3 FlgL